jgi:hypothetical protein
MHDELADAFSQYQEGSSERMLLALEHLRALRTNVQPMPTASAPTPVQDRRVRPPVSWDLSTPWERWPAHVVDLIDAYADPSLHPDIERIARVITSRAYRKGVCFVSWTKLAGWLKMEDGVLQGHLAEMEREELIRITLRDGATPLIQFADGTLNALHYKRVFRITTQERTHPRVVRTFANRVLRHGDD